MTNNDKSELLKQSISKIKHLQNKLAQANAELKEKIAVIGMACRFPGGCNNPEEYWQFLNAGGDGAIEIPADRWNIDDYYDPIPGKPNKMYVRKSNFLKRDVSEFDAKFFQISPAEANVMDPQQRQLLEVCWESLENAGQNADELKGSNTGVFIGISSNGEYGKLPQDESKINQYVGTGNNSSIASGRISYYFGWNGPAVSVDTACSSSMVTTHLAAESLRKRECDMAISAGVSLMLSPVVMSSLCSMNAISANGVSKPFDADGSGYGRGEGCGVLVLKRLSDAQRDGDTIYAVIEGSAINNDGASSGLTVPNGKAQKKVIGDALANANLNPNDIDYIEAHGTGTPLGDPIEFDAIKDVYFGKNVKKRDHDLVVGAVKGNIGHLESAAAVSSIIKVVLSLTNHEMPPIANFHNLNPRIVVGDNPIVFPTSSMPWNSVNGKRRIAGISSFGFSGTNGHMILSEYVSDDNAEERPMDNHILFLSAKDEEKLVEKIKSYKDYFNTHKDLNVADVCFTTNVCRVKYRHCAVFIGNTIPEFISEFDEVLEKYEKEKSIYISKVELIGSSLGDDRLKAKRTLFGNISDSIYTSSVDDMIKPKLAFVFNGKDGNLIGTASKLYEVFDLFKEEMNNCFECFKNVYKNIESDFKNFEKANTDEKQTDILLFSVEYSLIKLFESFGIVPEITVGEKVGAYVSAVTSGIIDLKAAADMLMFETDGDNSESMTGRFADVKFKKPRYRYMSADSGATLRSTDEIKKDLIQPNLSSKADYEKIMDSLYQQGYRFFIEFGINSSDSSDCLNDKADVVKLALLQNGNSLTEILQLIARCICLGGNIKWRGYYNGYNYKKILLPNYPFGRNHYWITPPSSDSEGFGTVGKVSERFIGKPINLPYAQKQYHFVFSSENFREVADNSGVVHVGYYFEMLKNVMGDAYADESYRVKDMEFVSALMIFEGENKEVLLVLEPNEDDSLSFKFYSKNVEQNSWNMNVNGKIVESDSKDVSDIADIPSLQKSCGNEEVNGEDFYNMLEEKKGMYFGGSVRWIDKVYRSGNEVFAKFRQPTIEDGNFKYGLNMNPGIVDSAAQICNYIVMCEVPESKKYMVSSISGISFSESENTPKDVFGHIAMKKFDMENSVIEGQLEIFDEAGNILIRIDSIELKEFDEEKMGMLQEMLASKGNKNGKDDHFLMQYMNAENDKKIELLTEYVRGIMADVLGCKPDEISIDEPIDDLGLDSMSGLQFFNKTVELLGVEIPFSDLAQCKNLVVVAKKVSQLLPGRVKVDLDEIEEDNEEAVDDMSVEHWIYNYKPNPKAKLRLFCFPNGFRSADMFDEWQKKLGDDIQVCAIMIPGLDIQRIKENAPTDVNKFVEKLEKVLEDAGLLDVPCSSFGHSWGSLFSYRLGYKLSHNPKADYRKLFISGYTSPQIKNSSIVKILNEIKPQGFNRIPEYREVRDDPKAIDVIAKAYQKVWDYDESSTKAILPLLLSACCIIDRYEHNPDEKFEVPIVGFHGIDDYIVEIDEMNAWENITSDSFKLYTMAGDHQFVNENQSEDRLIGLIRQEIDESVSD